MLKLITLMSKLIHLKLKLKIFFLFLLGPTYPPYNEAVFCEFLLFIKDFKTKKIKRNATPQICQLQ